MRALGWVIGPLSGVTLAFAACVTARERVPPPAAPAVTVSGYSVCPPAGDGWVVRPDQAAGQVRFDYPVWFQEMLRPFRVGFGEVVVTRFEAAEAECAAGADAVAARFREEALLALLAAEREDRGRCQLVAFGSGREAVGPRQTHAIHYQYECAAEHGEMGLDADVHLWFPVDFARGRAFYAVFAAQTYGHLGTGGHSARVDPERIRPVLASLEPE